MEELALRPSRYRFQRGTTKHRLSCSSREFKFDTQEAIGNYAVNHFLVTVTANLVYQVMLQSEV